MIVVLHGCGGALASQAVIPPDINTGGAGTDSPPKTDGADGASETAVEVVVDACRSVDDELVDAMARLIPQLSSHPPPGRTELEEIVASGAATLFVARLQNRIVGALTLVAFRIPTGLQTRIEDVVVDEAFRGRRVAEKLARAALETARRMGARSTDLTSRPSRQAANRLYTRMGFERRESNLYRYTL